MAINQLKIELSHMTAKHSDAKTLADTLSRENFKLKYQIKDFESKLKQKPDTSGSDIQSMYSKRPAVKFAVEDADEDEDSGKKVMIGGAANGPQQLSLLAPQNYSRAARESIAMKFLTKNARA